MQKVKAVIVCLFLCGVIVIAGKADNTNQINNAEFGIGSEAQVYEDTIPVPCCEYIRGNVDNDLDDIIDINDLNYLIQYSFFGGPAPECFFEADVDGNGVIQAALDINYLVNYMFKGGPQPPRCPK